MAECLRYWLPAIAWVALIALLSSDLGQAGWTYKWVQVAFLFFPLGISPKTIDLVHIAVCKLAHLSEYCILTLPIYRALRQDVLGGAHWRWAGWAATAAVTVAGLDELHRAGTVRRSGSLVDVGIDALGVLVALALLAWLQFHAGLSHRQSR